MIVAPDLLAALEARQAVGFVELPDLGLDIVLVEEDEGRVRAVATLAVRDGGVSLRADGPSHPIVGELVGSRRVLQRMVAGGTDPLDLFALGARFRGGLGVLSCACWVLDPARSDQEAAVDAPAPAAWS